MSGPDEIFHTWVLKPEYLPGWFQAFAATVALGISVLALHRTDSVARRRDRLEKLGIAVAIYPEIQMLKANVQNVRENIERIVKHDDQFVGQSVGAHIQQAAHIDIPPMLFRNIDRLFILGDPAGLSCIHLARFIDQYNAAIEQLVARIMIMNAEQWREAVKHIEEHLVLLDGIIDSCEHHLKPIHDSMKN